MSSIPMWQIENLFYLSDENNDGKTTFAELTKFLISKDFEITNETFDVMLDYFTIPLDQVKEHLFTKFYPCIQASDEKKEELLRLVEEKAAEAPLTLYKINELLTLNDVSLTKEDLGKLMDSFAIDVSEFVELFKKLFPDFQVEEDKVQVADDELLKLFQDIDTNQNNQLSLQEIITYLTKHGFKYSIRQCEELVKKYDYDGDKQLNINEFQGFLKELLTRK